MYRPLKSLVYLNESAICITVGQRGRSPTTKNCAPQATAVCGCGERQPTVVQWKVSVRGSLLHDQGIPSAREGMVYLLVSPSGSLSVCLL
ncbi:hypothetical protein TNIN_179741 [Trichonephila inaurata madagascariensis]|uniref:Uncharacterized protein n=1 Tax=Trichonephila inaurata madagascariensis TaxID=2747483 RepID=A0A8X7BXD7_9ARAC|nr:hypothetical protein TNIN_179741 [Trichonephila inaurata madagascariensis]